MYLLVALFLVSTTPDHYEVVQIKSEYRTEKECLIAQSHIFKRALRSDCFETGYHDMRYRPQESGMGAFSLQSMHFYTPKGDKKSLRKALKVYQQA